MKSAEQFAKEMDIRAARWKALDEGLKEARGQQWSATAKAVLFFFAGSAGLAWTGKLTVGAAILLAFSCLVWRYTWAQYRMNKWSEKRLADIDIEFPRPENEAS